MIQKAWRTGNSLVITIPKDEAERRGITEGQLLDVTITPLEVRPALEPTMQAALTESLAEDQEALRYLADRRR